MTDHTTLELHADDNFIFALDVSGSMQATDCIGGLSRFDFSIEKMRQFMHEAANFEEKGICVFRFGHQVTKFDHIDKDSIDSIIAASIPNEMATRTDLVIQEAYDEHKEDDHEDTFLFLITDGEPTKPQAVIDVITRIANDVKDATEFKIVFLTVGKISDNLKTYLDTLDNGIASKNDIVSVMELEKVSFLASIGKALGDNS